MFLPNRVCPPFPEIKQQTVEYGEPGTLDWRLYFHDGKRIISPFHDLPLSPVYGG